MYNVAIIGCGRISHKIAEGVAKNNDRMKLVVLCDPIEEKMYETEKTYNKKMYQQTRHKKWKKFKGTFLYVKIEGVVFLWNN